MGKAVDDCDRNVEEIVSAVLGLERTGRVAQEDAPSNLRLSEGQRRLKSLPVTIVREQERANGEGLETEL